MSLLPSLPLSLFLSRSRFLPICFVGSHGSSPRFAAFPVVRSRGTGCYGGVMGNPCPPRFAMIPAVRCGAYLSRSVNNCQTPTYCAEDMRRRQRKERSLNTRVLTYFLPGESRIKVWSLGDAEGDPRAKPEVGLCSLFFSLLFVVDEGDEGSPTEIGTQALSNRLWNHVEGAG